MLYTPFPGQNMILPFFILFALFSTFRHKNRGKKRKRISPMLVLRQKVVKRGKIPGTPVLPTSTSARRRYSPNIIHVKCKESHTTLAGSVKKMFFLLKIKLKCNQLFRCPFFKTFLYSSRKFNICKSFFRHVATV